MIYVVGLVVLGFVLGVVAMVLVGKRVQATSHSLISDVHVLVDRGLVDKRYLVDLVKAHGRTVEADAQHAELRVIGARAKLMETVDCGSAVDPSLSVSDGAAASGVKKV